MYRFLLALLASTLLMTACVPNDAQSLWQTSESSDACSASTSATSVQVFLPPGSAAPGKGAYRLTDPQAVRRLVDFVNLRRSVSPPSADTPPTPKLKTTFYNGYHHVAIFGSGAGVFYLQCGTTVRGTRYASATEEAEFEFLIARPDAAQ